MGGQRPGRAPSLKPHDSRPVHAGGHRVVVAANSFARGGLGRSPSEDQDRGPGFHAAAAPRPRGIRNQIPRPCMVCTAGRSSAPGPLDDRFALGLSMVRSTQKAALDRRAEAGARPFIEATRQQASPRRWTSCGRCSEFIRPGRLGLLPQARTRTEAQGSVSLPRPGEVASAARSHGPACCALRAGSVRSGLWMTE